jgi:hypothetical protein
MGLDYPPRSWQLSYFNREATPDKRLLGELAVAAGDRAEGSEHVLELGAVNERLVARRPRLDLREGVALPRDRALMHCDALLRYAENMSDLNVRQLAINPHPSQVLAKRLRIH